MAPGTYVENVTIDHALTLNGAQAGVPVSGRTASGPTESTIVGANPSGGVPITIKAAATIDGFSIKNTVTSFSASGIDVKSVASGSQIKNDIIDTITTADVIGNGSAQGIYLEAGPDNVSILGNRISNVHGNLSTKGVYIGDSSSSDPSTGIVVQGNSISNITSDTRGAYGVTVNDGNGATANAGLQITGNTISGLTGGGWVHAIGIEANAPGVVVTNNYVSNSTTSSANAVAVWFEADPSFASAQVHDNNFNLTAASYGIAVHPALTGGTVNGMCNWWGAANGPGPVGSGSGAKVSANVTYAPWLASPAPSPCNGNVATDKDQCKNGGWASLFRADGTGFKNQGDCIQYVNTGK